MKVISARRTIFMLLAVAIALSIIPFTVLAVPTINADSSLPSGIVGVNYSTTLGASSPDGDGSIRWDLDSGHLPDGLTLAINGKISGVPTTEGTFGFDIAAADTDGYSEPKRFSIVILADKVTSVQLNKSVMTLAVGGKETLTAMVIPDNATNASVEWASSNTAVATVSDGVVTAVAPGTTNVTATAGGIIATCTVTVPSLENIVIKGRAYLYGSGGKTTLGGVQIYGNTNTGYYLNATTDASGNYSIVIPASQNPTSFQMTASSNFILGRLLLNKDETNIDNGYRTVTVAEASNGVDFYFADPPKVSGRVLSLVDGPLQDAYVSVWDGVKTDANGKFSAQSYISSIGDQYVYFSVSADNHYYNSMTKKFNVTVETLKAGMVLNAGDITLEKMNQGGVFGDYRKNNLSLMPSTVSSGETSNATVNIYADQSAVLPNAQIKVKAGSAATILAGTDRLVRITANGQVLSQSQYVRVMENGALIVTLDLQPRTQYQVTFGIKAPPDLMATDYTATASVNDIIIGKQVVTIHNLNINAPAEIGLFDSFTVYGEVVSGSSVALKLSITSPMGETFTQEKAQFAGYFYKFQDIKIPDKRTDYPAGEYKVKVEMSKEGRTIAKAETKMLVSEKPVSVKFMSLQDDFNTVSVSDPAPGSFLTFVGWVDGTLWSMDYRNLKAEVKLNNADQVTSAQFIMKTTHGKFSWNANRSGDAFSALLPRYQGTGKAVVSLQATKKDGSVTTYTIGNIVILIDPSGYVYDTKTNARVEGAKATLYYDIGRGWELWPADEYMQINPQNTDGEGMYGWMVPEGKYKVVVEKDGYESFDTYETVGSKYKDLNVLPEQKDINIGLTPLSGGSNITSNSTSGNSSSSFGPRIAAMPKTTWMTSTNAKNTSRSTGVFGVRGSAWAKLRAATYYHETTSGNSVQVRVSVKNPSLLKYDALLSGYVKGAKVDQTYKLFTKWCGNKLQVIHFDQQTDWESSVEIAAKVNLNGIDTARLNFYSYDKKANHYKRIVNPEYRIDTNGYLHFVTPYAGDIIISEGELAKK